MIARAIHQQRAPFSGILIINNEDIEVEGTIYTHDFQLTSMTRVSKRDMFYRLNFARSGYLIGLYKNSTIACHGRYGGYILSFEGIINEELEEPISEYPNAHLAPFWQ